MCQISLIRSTVSRSFLIKPQALRDTIVQLQNIHLITPVELMVSQYYVRFLVPKYQYLVVFLLKPMISMKSLSKQNKKVSDNNSCRVEVWKQTKICRILVSQVIARFPISPKKAFMKLDLYFTTWKLGSLNISEYLARYSIQMKQSVTERSWQSGKKPVTVLCMLGLLSTIIREREQSDQEWHSWKDCPGNLILLNTDNVDFCTRSHPYQREASRPSGPGRAFFLKEKVCFLQGHPGT